MLNQVYTFQKVVENRYLTMSKRIPNVIRKSIIREGFIDLARNTGERGTPMEFLFDVWNTYIDFSGHFDDYNCPRCRDHVLSEWKKIKPFLVQLINN